MSILALTGLLGCTSPPPIGQRAATDETSPVIDIRARLRAGATLKRFNDGWRLAIPKRTRDITRGQRGEAYLAQALFSGWMTAAQLKARYAEGAASTGENNFEAVMAQLLADGFLTHQVRGPAGTLFELEPSTGIDCAAIDSACAGGVWRLSRFAYLHAADNALMLESPLTTVRCRLHHPGLAALLSALPAGVDGEELRRIAKDEGLADAEAGTFLAQLAKLGFITEDDSSPAGPTSASDRWEFHDLLFHARSLEGRHIYPMGGTYRLRAQMPSPPVVKPPMSANRVAFPPADAALKTKMARPFDQILAARRSIREQGKNPVSLAEVGAFLEIAARIQKFENPSGEEELSLRPAPSGGARHPLEIYLLVNRCEGLEPGLYHYRPDAHELERLEISGPRRAEFLAMNPFQAWKYPLPQALLLISARYARTAWKYESLAYRIIQNDLGCLEQTMYLAATALDLAPCTIGNVDPDLFAAVTGIDYYEEPLIAAFSLNSK